MYKSERSWSTVRVRQPDFQRSVLTPVFSTSARARRAWPEETEHGGCESVAGDNSTILVSQAACHARFWLKTPNAREQGKREVALHG